MLSCPGIGSPLQVAGLKRHLPTASRAASSRPLPPDSDTVISCGFPFASTDTRSITKRSLLDEIDGPTLERTVGLTGFVEQSSSAPGGGLNKATSGDGSTERSSTLASSVRCVFSRQAISRGNQ